MVSSSNLALVGVALLVGFFLLRGSSNVTPSLSNSQIPQAFNIIQDPKQTLALPQFFKDVKFTQEKIASLPSLEKLFSEASNIFRNTFKAPRKISKFQARREGIGSFAAKGTISTIDPFTGLRTAIGQTFRGTSRGAAVFGGVGQLAINRQRVIQGNILKSMFSDFLAGLRGEINIIKTISV